MTEADLQTEHDIIAKEYSGAELKAFERGYRIGRLHAELEEPPIDLFSDGSEGLEAHEG